MLKRLYLEIPQCIRVNDETQQLDFPITVTDDGALELRIPMQRDVPRKIPKDTIEYRMIHQLVTNYVSPEVSVLSSLFIVNFLHRYILTTIFLKTP